MTAPDQPPQDGRQIALWSALSAFFGNIVGLKVLEHLSGQTIVQVLGAVILSAFVGAAVYSRERLAAVRRTNDTNRR